MRKTIFPSQSFPILIFVQKNNPGKVLACNFPESTVMFVEVSGFSRAADTVPPLTLVSILNAIYAALDDLIDSLDCKEEPVFKVDNIG